MNKKLERNSYLLIVLLVIAVLAVSALVFTKYLEEQSQQTDKINTFLSSNTIETETNLGTEKVVPTPKVTTQSLQGISSSNEVLQLLADSINNTEAIESNYHRFREGQLEDISLEEFQLFVRLLKQIIGQRVDSFAAMSFSERKITEASILGHDSAYADFLDSASYHWLEYSASGTMLRFPILLSQNDNGQSYLSREWVRASLELRNFSALYFGALADVNTETLSRLIYADTFDQDIVKEKVDTLLKYYDSSINLDIIQQSEIISLRIDQIQLRIPILPESKTATSTTNTRQKDEIENLAENTDDSFSTTYAVEVADELITTETTAAIPSPLPDQGIRYHVVTIYKQNEQFVIVDTVPENQWKKEAIVKDTSTDESIVMSEPVNLESLTVKFGEIQKQEKFHFLEGNDKSENFFKIIFDDISLILRETEIIENQQTYVIEGIDLFSSRFIIDSTYKVGMSQKDLYDIYLYLDNLNYSYLDSENNQVSFQLNHKDKSMEQIQIRSSLFRSNLILKERSQSEIVELIKESQLTEKEKATDQETQTADATTENEEIEETTSSSIVDSSETTIEETN